MEQIYNSVLGMIQTGAERQTSSAASVRSDSTQSSEFRKMLERKQPEQSAGAEKSPDVTADKAADLPSAEDADMTQAESDLELQQMVWAAMFAAPQTAVPAEPIVEAEKPAESPALVSAPAAADAQPDTAPQDRLTVDDGAVWTGEPAAAQNQQIPVEEPAQAEAKGPELSGKDGLSEKAPDAAGRDSLAAEQPEQSGEAEQRVDYSVETPVFREVQTIPVKVGETAGTEQTGETQSVQNQLNAQLTQALQNGETKVELQLEPANLGRVRVEMTWDQEGALHVSLYAQNSHTRSLLERDLTGLQSLLGRNTQQEVHVEVPRQQESQQQNLYDGRDGREQNGQQQQEQSRRQNRQNSGEEFLQQLRLGLIRLDGEAS